ncbi:MAG: hypothetical protein ACC628_24585 [Pirellulaceae bacterium]
MRLWHGDAKAAVANVKDQLPDARIKLDEAKYNVVIVEGDENERKLIHQILVALERKAHGFIPVDDLDPETMTDAQLRETVVSLAKTVNRLLVGMHRLEASLSVHEQLHEVDPDFWTK